MDIAFTRRRIAVYVDGCFWHGCPEHLHIPHANSEWWVRKLAGNRARDAAATEQLTGLGWTVLRFWEHQDPQDVVARIATVLAERAVHSMRSGPADHVGGPS
jgi:DNA mismatch endonuclease (patch repair protein)